MAKIVERTYAIEVGHTGPDWEPTDKTKWYAECLGHYRFGPTCIEAVKALIEALDELNQ